MLKNENIKGGLVKEKPTRHKLTVYIDSEYKTDVGLSIQARCELHLGEGSISTFAFIVVNRDFQCFVPQNVLDKFLLTHNTHVLFLPFGDDKSPLLDGLTHFLYKLYGIRTNAVEHTIIDISLYMFYSIKDITYSLGWDQVVETYYGKKGSLKRFRGLCGRFNTTVFHVNGRTDFRFKVHDLFGIDAGGLASVAEGCGLKVKDKKALETYREKNAMDLAIMEKPLTFLQYGIFDCNVLHDILEQKIKGFNKLLTDIFNMPESALFTKSDFPLTLGTAVSQVWDKYLNIKIFKNDPYIKLALAKHSVLERLSVKYRDNLGLLEKLYDFTSLTDLKARAQIKEFDSLLQRQSVRYEIYSMGGIRAFTDGSEHTSKSTLGFTTGGRTVNERPKEYNCKVGADIDIAGKIDLNAFCSTIESIKNGVFLSTKYYCSPVTTLIPHILVMSNALPYLPSLSLDR